MIKHPLVSVFMPVFNQEKLVSDSIESVINQTFDDWELIIVDDCSTDNTFAIASKYADAFPGKIKAYRNSVNLGVTRNCNEVLGKCQGKYIAFTAGDDLFLPKKLELQVELMEANPACVLSYHDVEVFEHTTGRVIKCWNSGDAGVSPVAGLSSKVARCLVEQGTGFLAALSVMAKRDAMPEAGYDVRVPVASDWLMWIDITAAAEIGARVGYISEVLARYRRHENSVTARSSQHASDPLMTLSIVEYKYPSLVGSVDKARGYMRYSSGITTIILGNHKLGRRLLLSSAKFGLYSPKILYWLLVSFFPKIRSVRLRRS
ncbi:glycosyltransferase [Castellaniella sp.]|uniref:glycosyltransferase n=1 Tax=Castellaniella sp. TaxID=1955812 RepID=UPI002AFF8DEA|nr:glycosyltransferase [Castellaniella sp.]